MDTEAQMRDARAEQDALPESSKGDDAAAKDAPLVCHYHAFTIFPSVAGPVAEQRMADLGAICAHSDEPDEQTLALRYVPLNRWSPRSVRSSCSSWRRWASPNTSEPLQASASPSHAHCHSSHQRLTPQLPFHRVFPMISHCILGWLT